jgi:hypothetical protein
MSIESTSERWYAVGCGNEWRLTSGYAKVIVWLDNDEKTYKARICKRGGRWLYAGTFNDIKEAKSFCREEIGKIGSCLEVLEVIRVN